MFNHESPEQKTPKFLQVIAVFIPLLCGLFLSANMVWADNLRRMVEFSPDTPVQRQKKIIEDSGSTLLYLLPIIHSAAIQLPATGTQEALDAIYSHSEVIQVHDDPALSPAQQRHEEGAASNLIAPAAPPQSRYTWNLLQIALNQVDTAVQGQGIHVAVVDTGIDATHPALVDVVAGGYSAVTIPSNIPATGSEGGESEGGESEGSEGAVASYQDCNGHGTHVAGIIADSMTGVAPKVKLHAVRVLDCNGGGFVSDLIKGLSWIYEHPEIRVVNMSLGFYKSGSYPLLRQVINVLHNAGVVLITSAGNYQHDCLVTGADTVAMSEGGESLAVASEGGESEGGEDYEKRFVINPLGCNTRVKFPARYPETIAVAASDKREQMAYYSINGPEVDVTAPGGTYLNPVLSTNIIASASTANQVAASEGGESLVVASEGGESEGGERMRAYGHGSGTSMAAPHVTGVVALMLSVNPALTPDDVRTILLGTADNLGLPASAQGYGLINAASAVETALSWSGVSEVEEVGFISRLADIDQNAIVSNDTIIFVFADVMANSLIMADAWIMFAAIVGDNNTIGKRARIYYQAVLSTNIAIGHDARIEERTKIGDGGENIFGTTIGDFTRIGEDGILGNNVYIGHYTTIDNDVRIRDRTIIRDNTVVGKWVTIGTNVTIGSNVVIGDDIVVCDGEIVEDGTVLADRTGVGTCPEAANAGTRSKQETKYNAPQNLDSSLR